MRSLRLKLGPPLAAFRPSHFNGRAQTAEWNPGLSPLPKALGDRINLLEGEIYVFFRGSRIDGAHSQHGPAVQSGGRRQCEAVLQHPFHYVSVQTIVAVLVTKTDDGHLRGADHVPI